MTFAPKTEVYIRLVCAQYKPEYLILVPPITTPRNQTNPPLPPNSPMFAHYEFDNGVTVNMPDNDFLYDPFGQHDGDVHVHVPRPSSKCTSDPEVGRIVAGLSAAISLTMGILSIITTGFWTSVSDTERENLHILW